MQLFPASQQIEDVQRLGRLFLQNSKNYPSIQIARCYFNNDARHVHEEPLEQAGADSPVETSDPKVAMVRQTPLPQTIL